MPPPTCRRLPCYLWVLALLSSLLGGLRGAEAARAFDIPAGPAEKSLRLFSSQSGVEILFSTAAAKSVQTNAVQGAHPPTEALRLLLNGTSLRAVNDERNGVLRVTIDPAAPARRTASVAGPAGALSGSVAAGGHGVVSGRIFDPLTGEYVRNAEIRVRGTDLLSLSQGDGRYRLSDVPAGPVTITVSYPGLRSALAALTIVAGEVATQDFNLQRSESTDAVVQLGRFTVSTEREGSAKAITEQRNAMNIKNVIASDTFGDMVEGNLAEVLQYLPGMEIDYDGGDPVSFRIRGMAPQYSALTVDGVRLPSNAGGARSPQLTAYSANASDMLEFNKTNSADMDADAPAGSVNMRSKSAFQRKGRFFSFQLYGMVNSEQLALGRTVGPNDGKSRKTVPGVMLDFSDVYLDGRLGLVLSLSESNSLNEQANVTNTYNTTPTAARPAPIVVTGVSYVNAPKLNQRRGGGVSLEYKFTSNLHFALRGQFNTEDARIYNRSVGLVTTRPNLTPDSDALSLTANSTTNNATRFTIGGQTTERRRNNHTIAPQLTYTGDRIEADATVAYTRGGQFAAESRLEGGNDTVRGATYQLFPVSWRLSRGSSSDTAWSFQQLSGLSLYDLANWRAASTTNNITRVPSEPIRRQLLAQLNAKYTTSWTKVPTFFKAGAKFSEQDYHITAGSYSWTYVGPGNNRITADIPVSVYVFDPEKGGNLFTDRSVQLPDRHALGVMLKRNPEYFTANPADATSDANRFSHRHANEKIQAAYAMANSRLGRLMLQGGLRYEATSSRSLVYERGAVRQRRGDYDDLFLSAAGRYRFTDDLMGIVSFSESIQRTNLANMTGLATINEEALTGSIPNPELKPEHGRNYSARLEYYFKSVGVIAAGVFMSDISDLQYQRTQTPAEEIGLGDEYPGYLFTSWDNAGKFKVEGFELEYNQQLTFLPGVLRGLGIFGNYTQVKNSDPELAYSNSPKTGSAGVSFRYRGFNVAVRASKTAETLISATAYREARTMLGLSAGYKLSQHLSLFFTGRNVLNEPIVNIRRDYAGHLSSHWHFGSNWSFGIKGVY